MKPKYLRMREAERRVGNERGITREREQLG